MGNTELMIEQCDCLSGCPVCVGPIEEVGIWGELTARKLLRSEVQTKLVGRDDSNEHAESAARAPEGN